MPRLVIACGNSLRGDDGVGPAVAKRLGLLVSLPRSAVSILTTHQLTPELAQAIGGAERVVFVDASADGEPGAVTCRRVLPDPKPPTTFSHHLPPGTLLALTAAIHGCCPDAWLVSVGGVDFDTPDQLSPPVAAALPRLIEAVRGLIE